ncbi:MAG: hypothetical protein MJA83_06585 [Gammaproteobacteria bacterium]|nr:hypothetical protein [Gammaproteobacteria bacterium]
MSLEVSAPGKLVLLGEYAVLEGAPALVMAVDRRARVRLEPQDAGLCSVTRGRDEGDTAEFQIDQEGGLRWLGEDGARGYELFALVWAALIKKRRLQNPENAFHINLDTDGFFEPGFKTLTKLGLGSSAALTAALIVALLKYAGTGQGLLTGDDAALLEESISVHADFQAGRGSGLDIAASLSGGVISFQRSEDAELSVKRVTLPRDLQFLTIWSGKSASTPGFLAKIAAWREGSPAAFQDLMLEMSRISSQGIAALAEEDTNSFLDFFITYGQLMKNLGKLSGADIVSAEHEEIRALADKAGIAYKPCGAGGGDVGMACSNNEDKLAGFKKLITAAGYTVVPLSVDYDGIKMNNGLE